MAPVDEINSDAPTGRYSFSRRLLIYAVLASAYIVSGRLGLLLAVQPGYATAVFLPAGIAVAASFMLGAAVLPAIFVSSLLLNVWVGSSIDHEVDATALTIALIIASASTLQAATGGTVLRRSIGYPTPMDTARDVAMFLVLAPVICLISATLSLTGIWAVRAVEPPELLINWLTWWVGDTLGTLVALPLMLVLGGEPRSLWRSRASFIAVPMIVCFALFVAIFVRVSTWETDASLSEFKLQSQRVAERIKTNLEEQGLFLDQLASVFAGQSRGLTRDDFHRLVDRLLHQYPTIQAVEWAPRVLSAEREAFEAAQRTEIPSFAIRERNASGELVPAANSDQFYPVTYVQPIARNEQALGFDLTSDPDRRAAIENTNKSSDVVATAPIRLVQEHANQFGILLVKSVDDNLAEPGVVLVVLRLGTFTRMLAEPLESILNVRFIDSDAKQPLFDSFVAAPLASYSAAFDFGGRHYLVQTSPTAFYLAQHRGWQSWAVLAAGVLSTGLLGALLMLGTGHAYRVEKLAQSRQQLATIVETSRDAIWSWTNDGTITSWNPEAERMLGYAAREMIGKSIVTLIPPDRIKLAYDIISKVSQGQSYAPWETSRIRKDGTSIPVELTVSPIHNSAGRVLGAATVCRDVTERKRAQARIATDLQDMTRLNELSNMLVRQGAPMDDILTATIETAIALAGAEKGSLQLFNPEMGTFTIVAHRGFDDPFLSVFESARDDAAELTATMRSGRRVVVEDIEGNKIFSGRSLKAAMSDAGVRAVISTPLMSSTGNLLGIISTHFPKPHRPEERELHLIDLLARETADYLERKRIETALRRQLVEIETLYNNAPVGLCLFDRELRFVRVNSALAEINGIPAREHIGRLVWDIVPTLRSIGEPLLLRVLETGEIATAETAGETAKQPGVTRHWNAVHYPLKGENGEVAAVGVIVEEITERKRAEQRQEMLINELNHRVKNTLSVIQSIAMQTLKNADKRHGAYEAFQSRLMALADAHDILTRGGWEAADIYEIVTRAAAPYREPEDRFAIHGPSLPVGGKATIAFALALNELCTNSAKYGALSIPTGHVEVQWSASGGLHLVWKEMGGPTVRPPKDEGFGSFLITRVLADDIDGRVELDYRPSGLVCTVKASLPLPRANDFPSAHN